MPLYLSLWIPDGVWGLSIGAILDIEESLALFHTAKPIEYIVTERGCWECISHATGPTSRYPRPYRNGQRIPAHRYIYELLFKKIKDGLLLLHRCDNTLCVNPSHMFEGTQKDNALDREAKGRGVDNNNRRDSSGRYC